MMTAMVIGDHSERVLGGIFSGETSGAISGGISGDVTPDGSREEVPTALEGDTVDDHSVPVHGSTIAIRT